MIYKPEFLEFLDDYLNLLTSRLTAASITFDEGGDSANYANALMFESNLKAIGYLFKSDVEILRPDVIQQVAKLVDYDVNDKGFRRTNVEVGGSNVERTKAKDIHMHIYSLLDSYYKIWPGMEDPYLREAYFHITFLHIHPFEDGNGRVARILTAYNLFKNGETPFVINRQHKSEYVKLIEESNYEGMAELFRTLAKEETSITMALYEKYYNHKEPPKNIN